MRPISHRPTITAAALAWSLAWVAPAVAQMVLPGAVAPTPEGAPVAPEARPTKAPKPHGATPEGAIRVAPPAVSPAPLSLVGLTLFLNGRKSQITFAEHDKALQVSRLLLAGTHPTDAGDCQVDVPGMPLGSTDLGKPNGVSRIKIVLPACPIVFDILDGAVLAVGDPPSCDFPDKTCRINPAGLWGPQAGAIGPAEVKTIERARAQAEGAVRTDFKLLLTTTRDRPTISDYAREQAGFSSAREEICRDYAGEGRHGFCATRLTQARAAALRAKYSAEAVLKQVRKKARAGK